MSKREHQLSTEHIFNNKKYAYQERFLKRPLKKTTHNITVFS